MISACVASAAAFAVGPSSASAFSPGHRRQCAARSRVALSAKRSGGEPGCEGGGGDDHTSADLDMEVLRRRMQRYGGGLGSSDAPYAPADLTACAADVAEGTHLDELEDGWVLLFAPGSDDEGVYTVQDDDELTYVLAFEAKEDAVRFAQQLEAEDWSSGANALPSVCVWSVDVLTEFCETGDFKIGFVPEGVRAAPPRPPVAPPPPRARAAAPDRRPRALPLRS